MEEAFKKIIEEIGEDLSRDGMSETPKRCAEAFRFLTKGYQEDIDKAVNNALFSSDSEEMIVVKDIELYSLCEHHLLPFIGKCHVAYIPNGKVIGISKIPGIVDIYSRRLQIQERLTKQIADTILKYTKARGVGVVIEAKHLCIMMRGVQKQNSVMMTSCMLGTFRTNQSTREEFLKLIR